MTHNCLSISVIIPTFNRAKELRKCLEAMAKMEFPVDRFELIIVDDGSSCDLGDVIHGFKDRLPIQLVRKENGGPASARNAGAAVAVGRYIAFTDDDCHPAFDWLTRLEARLQQEPNALVGGRSVNVLPSNFFSATSQLILDVVYRFYNADEDNARFFASNNIAMARNLFHEMGGFDTSFPLAAAKTATFATVGFVTV